MANSNTPEQLRKDIKGYNAVGKSYSAIETAILEFIERGITTGALPKDYNENGNKGYDYQGENYPGATNQAVHLALDTLRDALKQKEQLNTLNRAGSRLTMVGGGRYRKGSRKYHKSRKVSRKGRKTHRRSRA